MLRRVGSRSGHLPAIPESFDRCHILPHLIVPANGTLDPCASSLGSLIRAARSDHRCALNDPCDCLNSKQKKLFFLAGLLARVIPGHRGFAGG
jgi:hypothetical protein